MIKMTFDDAVDFIVARLHVSGSERRSTRDKVRKRIKYALDAGSLPNDNYKVSGIDQEALLNWVSRKWPDAFAGSPQQVGPASIPSLEQVGEVTALLMPPDLHGCQEALRAAWNDIALLREQASHLTALVLELEPKAQRYDANCKTNQISGGIRNTST